MTTRAIVTGKSPKRNLLGPKAKRLGRHPKPTPAEQESLALARKLGRSALGRAVQVYLDGLEATKPIYMKADDGQGETAYIPGESIPDHAIRLRAADALCDRFGFPKKVETDGSDAFSAFMAAVQERLRERRDAEVVVVDE